MVEGKYQLSKLSLTSHAHTHTYINLPAPPNTHTHTGVCILGSPLHLLVKGQLHGRGTCTAVSPLDAPCFSWF